MTLVFHESVGLYDKSRLKWLMRSVLFLGVGWRHQMGSHRTDITVRTCNWTSGVGSKFAAVRRWRAHTHTHVAAHWDEVLTEHLNDEWWTFGPLLNLTTCWILNPLNRGGTLMPTYTRPQNLEKLLDLKLASRKKKKNTFFCCLAVGC